MKRLLLKMLDPDPERRITVHGVLATATVKGIECCAPESSEPAKVAAEEEGSCLVGSKKWSKTVMRKHSHVPPKEHKTPAFLVHRFDMGDGYR